jgi:pimeloyl-ACP methyl ester carboxylesterase
LHCARRRRSRPSAIWPLWPIAAENQSTPRRGKRSFWRRTGRKLPDGTARLRADPKHKLRVPRQRAWTTSTRCGAITAPVLWIAAADSHIRRWLAADGDADAELARRFSHFANGQFVTVADAGHMLHHDQPEVVARLLEAFLDAKPS